MRSLCLQPVIQPVLFPNCVDLYLSFIVFLLQVIAFRNSFLVFLQPFQQSGNVCNIFLPQNMTAIDLAAPEQGVFIQHYRVPLRRPHHIRRQLRCVWRGITSVIVRINDLCPYGSGFKQRFITGIGLDQSAMNTAFQYSGEHQTLRCSDVSADKLHPFHAAWIN